MTITRRNLLRLGAACCAVAMMPPAAKASQWPGLTGQLLRHGRVMAVGPMSWGADGFAMDILDVMTFDEVKVFDGRGQLVAHIQDDGGFNSVPGDTLTLPVVMGF